MERLISSLLGGYPVNTEEVVDLSSLGLSDFNPYLFERHSGWILLPVFAFVLVLIHLKKAKAIRLSDRMLNKKG